MSNFTSHHAEHQPLPWKTWYAGRQLYHAVERRREQSWSLPGLRARHGSSGEQTMSSYFHLRRLQTVRRLRKVRRSLTKESLLTLVHAFVTSRVDHCNGLLFGSHSYLLDRLQSVLNSAARLIPNIPKFSNISAAIRDELHWLPIRKSRSPLWSVTAWLVLRRNTWWNCAILLAQPSVDNVFGRLLVVTSLFRGFGFRHLAIGHSLSQASKFGTLFRSGSDNRVTIYCFSNINWKLIYFSSSGRFCGSISDEGPHKFPILLLLLQLRSARLRSWTDPARQHATKILSKIIILKNIEHI